MNTAHQRDPFHGVTLEGMLKFLIASYGWESLGQRIKIRCFYENPSLSSSLAFLRKTPWARAKVEDLYQRTAAQSHEERS